MLEGTPFQQLHDKKGLVVLLANLVDGADIGVVQGGRGSRFALKAFERLRVAGKFFRKELQGDVASELKVLGFIDDTHAAAEFPQNAVMGDGLADHWRESAP